jgi:Leucyl-tRNA synthetase
MQKEDILYEDLRVFFISRRYWSAFETVLCEVCAEAEETIDDLPVFRAVRAVRAEKQTKLRFLSCVGTRCNLM